MAEEGGGGMGPVQDALFLLGMLLVLVVLWFAMGGPSRADLRGIFLRPPAPIDEGGAYGPQINSSYIEGPSYQNYQMYQQ